MGRRCSNAVQIKQHCITSKSRRYPPLATARSLCEPQSYARHPRPSRARQTTPKDAPSCTEFPGYQQFPTRHAAFRLSPRTFAFSPCPLWHLARKLLRWRVEEGAWSWLLRLSCGSMRTWVRSIRPTLRRMWLMGATHLGHETRSVDQSNPARDGHGLPPGR